MKKLGLLMAVSAMLIAAPSVLASAAGRACRGTKAQRQIGLRVHSLSCQAAFKSLSAGTGGYKCKTAGQTRLIPYTIKCVSHKHKSTFYSYLFYGG